jgi:putative phage-type endonuclease
MIQMIQLNSRAEWLEKRKSYIGGSEAASIVGMNPYRSNVDLWELKTGRKKAEDISGNPYVRYGTNAENFLRELFTLDFPQYTVEYAEHNMWLNSEYPFAHASLDGWLTDSYGRRGVLEIKTTNIQNAAMVERWNNRIPDNYYIQVLHYLFVTGFDFAIVKAQLKWERFADQVGDVLIKTKHYVIEREEVEDDIAVLIDSERRFCEYLVTDTRPPLILPNI